MEPKELSPDVAGKILDADFQNVVRKVAAGKPLTVASGTVGAVYDGQSGPADITSAGGLSFYGKMGQGGNAREWLETENDGTNDSASSYRRLRGGAWAGFVGYPLTSSYRSVSGGPSGENSRNGFRVASVPEPSCWVLTMLASGMMLTRRKR